MKTYNNLTIKDLILIEKALRKNTPETMIKFVWKNIYPSELIQFLDHNTIVEYLKNNTDKPSTFKVAIR